MEESEQDMFKTLAVAGITLSMAFSANAAMTPQMENSTQYQCVKLVQVTVIIGSIIQ